jgi:uncharacterized protein YdhG (YjbR/CyaY superfamily)
MTNEIDRYISNFPQEVQTLLQQVRSTIKQVIPDAEEVIKYAIPTYVMRGTNLVHFGGFKNHIGFYPVPSDMEAFKKELSVYKGAKGSVQFPLNEPMPLYLIERIVRFRLKENEEKAAKKRQQRTCKNGHHYYKSSDCPTCPICEGKQKPDAGFFSVVGAPARRALENNGIKSLRQLSNFSEQDVLQFHGMGPSSIPKLKKALAAEGLGFRKN